MTCNCVRSAYSSCDVLETVVSTVHVCCYGSVVGMVRIVKVPNKDCSHTQTEVARAHVCILSIHCNVDLELLYSGVLEQQDLLAVHHQEYNRTPHLCTECVGM